MKRKTLMSWSSGKDSAWALYKLQQDPEIEIKGLFCTVNKKFNRVAMHAVRVDLLQQQAKCIGLPVQIIDIPYPCSNELYEEIMAQFVESAKAAHIEHFVFGVMPQTTAALDCINKSSLHLLFSSTVRAHLQSMKGWCKIKNGLPVTCGPGYCPHFKSQTGAIYEL